MKGLEPALMWIEQHQEDADFQEELFIVGQDDSASGENSNLLKINPNMSKEEKIQKAKEL